MQSDAMILHPKIISFKDINVEEISKNHKTESSVPPVPEVDLDFRGNPNMVAQYGMSAIDFLTSKTYITEEISKIYKTYRIISTFEYLLASVPKVDLDFRGHPNMVAQ